MSNREVSALDIARREMGPGEKLIWAERPMASVHARREKLSAFMGIFVCGFSAFMVRDVVQAPYGGIGFALFGVPFIVTTTNVN